MIKIKTKQGIKDFNGKEIKNQKGDVLPIGEQISNILSTANSNPSLAWQLGKKFATEKEVDLKAEEVVFLKKVLDEATGKTATAIITGQLIELLEGKEEK